MEENTSMFNNKIVGVLVAVIVLATVLVPICNAFSNSGGSDNPSPLASGGVYENPGNKLSKIDLNDTSKTYTFSIDDGYEVGDTVVIWEDEYSPMNGWNYFEIDGIGPTFVTSEGVTLQYSQHSQIKLAYNSEESVWGVYVYEGDEFNLITELYSVIAIYVADDNGEYYGSLNSTIYPTNLFDNFPQIKLKEGDRFMASWSIYPDNTEIWWSIIIDERGIILFEDIFAGYYDDDIFDYVGYEIISSPTLTINEQGFVEITNPKFVYLDNGNEVEVQMGSGSDEDDESLIVSGIYSQFVGGSDEPTDSGIAGTIIGYIPVFVAVALLGAIVTLFINKKD